MSYYPPPHATYCPVPQSAASPEAPGAPSSVAPPMMAALSPWAMKIGSSLLLVATLTGALLVAYNRCVGCVIAIALFALLTFNCIPLMPLVFMLSAVILLYHTIDYHAATIKVEVPLSNFIYVPTWDDVHRYVQVLPAAAAAAAVEPSPP